MHVTAEQELPAAMAEAGLELDDVSEVVLTHAHGDHMDGLVHVRSRVLINEVELRFLGSPMARVMRRVLRQPLPAGFPPEPFALDGGPFGAFRGAARSAMTGGSSLSTRPGTSP
jgi:glyoxylase-like metal-dependent hydrolase (beta-lactamase superfamily II)